MGNSLIFTGLILLAGLAGGLIGSACGKRRNAPDIEGRIAELEERLDALADHCMEEDQAIRERVAECELLIGDPPTEGLLGRVGALEEARSREDLLARVNMLTDEMHVLGDQLDTLDAHVMAFQNDGLEDAQRTHEQDAVIVNGWAEEIKALRKELEGLQMVNDAEHHALLEHQKGIVKDMREAKDARG